LFNTLSRSVEKFEPLRPDTVSLYTCGPTVYNHAHIGNLRTYIFEDVLKRVLKVCGHSVQHVMNITDVGHLTSDADEGEDKMALGARREGKSAWEIADYYWQAFRQDLKRLNIQEPDIWCKATDHIGEQIALIRRLEEKCYTYIIEGDGVYFDTSKLSNYGRLARLDVAKLQMGARVEMVAGKRNHTDFALWKFSPKDRQRLMEWDSPWGVGFPGWHIECSAMAIKYLGERLDIHCGGIDHIPVHHTNEIAQSESALGHPWVNYWVHGEFLTLSGSGSEEGKMSKSSGEFLTLDTLVNKGYDPIAYRLFCLGAHYRRQLTFTWEALDAAASAFRRLKRILLDARKADVSTDVLDESRLTIFRAAAEDDLNMPQALAVMWQMIHTPHADKGVTYATLLAMDEILGLGLAAIQEEGLGHDETEILSAIEKRDTAKKTKNYVLADQIRKKLTERGIVLEDTVNGTIWRKESRG
jgi:cysteinyl-tRNA synthetase